MAEQGRKEWHMSVVCRAAIEKREIWSLQQALWLQKETKVQLDVTREVADSCAVSMWRLLHKEQCNECVLLFVDPDTPEVPRIVSRNKGQIKIQLRPASNDNGPITSYRIVVLYEDCGHPITVSMLKSFQEAQREGLHCYIAAELDPKVRTSHQAQWACWNHSRRRRGRVCITTLQQNLIPR